MKNLNFTHKMSLRPFCIHMTISGSWKLVTTTNNLRNSVIQSGEIIFILGERQRESLLRKNDFL